MLEKTMSKEVDNDVFVASSNNESPVPSKKYHIFGKFCI